ncbi:MAG: Flp family type IVb pilin [Actinobacteria bacterium]|nr:Flp family type IVb pilin [Actinomycetota bacterium]
MELYLRMFSPREEEDKGAAMVEYGLLISFIAVAVIAVLIVLGPAIADLFQQVVDAI